MVNAWERFILNPETRIAHDAAHLTEECNTDQIVQKVRKPSIPPGFRLCRHCAAALFALGQYIEGVEVEEEDDKLDAIKMALGMKEAEGGDSGREENNGEGDSGLPGSVGGDGAEGQLGSPDDASGGSAPAGDGAGGPDDAGSGGAGVLPPAGDAGPGDGPTDRPDTPLQEPAALTKDQLVAAHALPGDHEVWPITNGANLRHMDYNIAQATLMVRFANGWEYVYGNVPFDAVKAVADADSPGTVFDAQIKKGKYAYVRVPAGTS